MTDTLCPRGGLPQYLSLCNAYVGGMERKYQCIQVRQGVQISSLCPLGVLAKHPELF